VHGDKSQKEIALDPLGPRKIGEEGFAVNPNDSKVENRKSDI
jgi:hypothetical protein